jgi:hypothetical protein
MNTEVVLSIEACMNEGEIFVRIFFWVLPKVLGATILALSLYREQSGCLVVKET